MTSFIGWIGVDQRKPSSVYLASDSRISWGQNNKWDYGKKLFATNTGPHVLGYIGDVLFPSLALGQVSAAIDLGLVFGADDAPLQRFERIQSILKHSFDGLPFSERRQFIVVYATRQLEFMKSTFHVFKAAWSPSSGWEKQEIVTPATSSSICIFGSGETEISKWSKRWESSSQGRTSRAVFSAFCDALHSSGDKLSGGAPQLARIYRKGPAKFAGIIWDNTPFLAGIPLNLDVALASTQVEWRNSFLERCDAKGNLLQNAQEHHVPKGLGYTLPTK
jgi:hypothetical protein